jgi:glycosyltransferase involved in cell wall biosynthesis
VTTPGPARHPLRVAFADIANTSWTAGSVYYKNLFGALGGLGAEERPEIVVVMTGSTKTGYDVYRNLADDVLTVPELRESSVVRDVRRIGRRLGLASSSLDLSRRAMQRALDEGHVDAMFVSWADFTVSLDTPMLGWIHDFQHVHYPEFFPKWELELRDRVFEEVARTCERVVLSSEDARKDYERFVPECAHNARVMRFVAQPPANVYDLDASMICREYNLPERFLYLPNQFWIHKGHRLVVEALAMLKSSRPDITVVCTGNPTDGRDPLHFGELLVEVSRKGVRDNFIVLGWVPHNDTFRLIRQSVAVLQPSLFEGWSTTVEETKSIGKTIVLSDIPIHREQSPASALYFDPTDPSSLAERMVEAYDTYQPGPDECLEAAARELLPARMREYAETFLGIVREAIAAR